MTEALVDWYRTRAFYDHWLVGAAGLNIGLESQVVGVMERVMPPLTEKYGFTNDRSAIPGPLENRRDALDACLRTGLQICSQPGTARRVPYASGARDRNALALHGWDLPYICE